MSKTKTRKAAVIPKHPVDDGPLFILQGEIIPSDQKDMWGEYYNVFYETGSDLPILDYTEVCLVESESDVPPGKNWNRSEEYGIFYFK